MENYIHFFSESRSITDEDILSRIGMRGRQAMEFASLDLPILPGFVINSRIADKLEDYDLSEVLEDHFAEFENITGKGFGDEENPMLVKIVISPNLAVAHYPTLHNFGLVEKTNPGFGKFVGEDFAHHEIFFLLKGTLQIEAKIASFEERDDDHDTIMTLIDDVVAGLDDNSKIVDESYREGIIQRAQDILPEGFFDDEYTQMEQTLKRISKMLSLDILEDHENAENETAIIVQPMVYGNYGKDSASGRFTTRNTVTGDSVIQGNFYRNEFNEIGAEGSDIQDIEKPFLTKLEKIAIQTEDFFKEIRAIRFTIENKKLWLIDQSPVTRKSTRADIRILLDLLTRKKIDEKFLVQAIKPNQINEIIHPVINMDTITDLEQVEGGIAGAPGAAIGRIYFSTDGLLDAHKKAQQNGEDTRFIFCKPATFAEDVKAIEVATGVISSEGGYSAHASVVARQYGKASLVLTELNIKTKQASINGVTIKEGDYITMNVPYYGDPSIYLGKATLIEPDPEESGLYEFMQIVKQYQTDFNVRVNADTPDSASLALKFGAEGIGLCRTEHMFFNEERINVFRGMIIADDREHRLASLELLQQMQQTDFYALLKIMEGKEVTIRLLDAPLHEFLPHNKEEMKDFVEYIKGLEGYEKISPAEIGSRCERLAEFNPMLGHRGCRIAVTYPEIYEMQIKAILEAAYQLQDEGVECDVEIMIPLIMNQNELKLIINGKKIEGQSYKGIKEIADELAQEKGVKKPIDFKVGTMIELPVAALGAGEIAKYAEFFSFGTNDLTQTTIGLSRDDYISFMPDYTLFDILEGNPFQMLDHNVKELISIAVKRGSLTRPDLKKGLCGEHGAIPENIRFCMDQGLNYVSCSAYSVSIANLAVAQYNIEQGLFDD